MRAVGPGLYSRVIAVLKVGLPLVALGLLSALFFGRPDDQPDGAGLVFAPGDVDALGSGLQISRPTMTGTTEAQDRFRFTAEMVLPDAAPPTRAAIRQLAGDIELADGPTVTIAADAGDLDLPTQRLDLRGRVRVRTSDGYTLDSQAMTAELRAGSLIASGDVVSVGPLGTIHADSLRVTPADKADSVRRFSFAGGVRLLYDPPDP